MSRTLAQLREQVRVLMGDAAGGSDRFTDPQILRALNWAQERAAQALGLTYLERNIAVVDKTVALPADVVAIPHVRLATLLSVAYPSSVAGEVGSLAVDLTPTTVGVNPLKAKTFAWCGAVAGLALDASTGKITGEPTDAFSGNVPVTLTNDSRTAETAVAMEITKPAGGGPLEVYTIPDAYTGSQGDSVSRMWTIISPGYLAHWHYPDNPVNWSQVPAESQYFSNAQARGDYIYIGGYDESSYGPAVLRHVHQDADQWTEGWEPWSFVITPEEILALLTPIDASIGINYSNIRSLKVDVDLNVFALLNVQRDTLTTWDLMVLRKDVSGLYIKSGLSSLPRTTSTDDPYLPGTLLWWAGNRRTVPYFIAQTDSDGNHALFHWLNGTGEPESIAIGATLVTDSRRISMDAGRARAFRTGDAWFLGIADSTNLKWGNLFKMVGGVWTFQAHGAFPAAVLDDGNFLTTSMDVTDLALDVLTDGYQITNHPYNWEPHPQVESYVMTDGAIFRTGKPANL